MGTYLRSLSVLAKQDLHSCAKAGLSQEYRTTLNPHKVCMPKGHCTSKQNNVTVRFALEKVTLQLARAQAAVSGSL